MKLSRSITVALILLASIDIQAQSLDSLVTEIAYEGRVDYEQVGLPIDLSTHPTQQYLNFTELSKTASTAQLVALTNHKSGTVIAYACWALIDRKYAEFPALFLNYINNDREIRVAESCEKFAQTLSKTIYDRAQNNAVMRARLDSTVVYSYHTNMEILTKVLGHDLPEGYTSRIEFLAFTWNRISALYYLNRMKKPEYADRVKSGILKYFDRSNLGKQEILALERLVETLLQFRDQQINTQVVARLNRDKSWSAHTPNNIASIMKRYGVTGLD